MNTEAIRLKYVKEMSTFPGWIKEVVFNLERAFPNCIVLVHQTRGSVKYDFCVIKLYSNGAYENQSHEGIVVYVLSRFPPGTLH